MFIEKKKIEEMLEEANEKGYREARRDHEMAVIWDRLIKLSKRVDKLEGVKETE